MKIKPSNTNYNGNEAINIFEIFFVYAREYFQAT